jgi:hypothetical protein
MLDAALGGLRATKGAGAVGSIQNSALLVLLAGSVFAPSVGEKRAVLLACSALPPGLQLVDSSCTVAVGALRAAARASLS